MAGKNVIRQDVVQIAWEVEPAPFSEVDRQVSKLVGNVGDVTKGMKAFDKSADRAGDAVADVAREGRKLRGMGADDAARDMKDLGGSAGKAEKSIRKVGGEKLTGLLSSLREANSKFKSMTEASAGLSGKLKGMALGALGAAAAPLGVGAALGVTSDYQKSVNQLQSQSGMSDQETEAASGSVRSLYADNMGEGFDDIARSISQVKSISGASGKALESMTRSALLMRDTFEFDVGESIRSVDMLMRQFGVSGLEAYSMIAQGAQNGLDKNGDLLDTVNEYSVHFKQLGFSGGQMMNMLVSGAKSGTFSVDKLGDAIKEFGVRSKDGSASTMKAFAALGLNAAKLSDDFAHGGAAGQKAFKAVAARLAAMKDPLQQDAAGVALFGSMWEDLQAKGVLALTRMDGKITQSADALNKINQIQYNDIGSALSALGRTFTTEVVLPLTTGLGADFTASVNRAKQYVADFGAGLRGEAGAMATSMGQVGFMFRAVGGVIGGVFGFVVRNANIVLPAIFAIVTAMAVWKAISTGVAVVEKIRTVIGAVAAGKTLIAAGAQWVMNTAMYACPAIWLVGILLAVVAVVGALAFGISKLIGKFTGAKDSIGDFGSSMEDFTSKDFTQDFTMNASMEGDLAGDYNKQLDGMQGRQVDFAANVLPPEYAAPDAAFGAKAPDSGEGFAKAGVFKDISGFNDSAEPEGYMQPDFMNAAQLPSRALALPPAPTAVPDTGAGSPDLLGYAPEQPQGYETQPSQSSFTYSPTIHVTVSGTSGDKELEQKITVRVRKILKDEFNTVRRKHPRLIEA